MLFGKKKKYVQEWNLDITSTITSSFSFGDEMIVFGTQDGLVIAVDYSGSTLWTHDTKKKLSAKDALFLDQEDANSILCTPFWCNKKIYVGTETGELHCISKDGALQWKKMLDGAIRASPTVIKDNTTQEDLIAVGTIDGSLYLLQPSGHIKKIIKTKSAIESSIVVVHDDCLVVGCGDGSILACNQKGVHLWSYKTKGKITADILVSELFSDDEKTLLVASQDNYLYVLSVDGELKWKFETKGALISAPITAHLSSHESRDILVGSCDNKVYCISAHGEELWTYETDFWVTASPTIVDKDGYYRICFGSYDQKFYVLDGQSEVNLDFMPGLAGIINQTGYTSMATSRDIGQNKVKKLFEQELGSHITFCSHIPNSQRVLVTTKQGKLFEFSIS